MPVAGDGRRADAAIQRILEKAAPHGKVAAGVQRRAVQAAWSAWRSKVGGAATARDRYRFTRMRLRAGIARTTAGHGRLVVHLVWAGADPRGEYRDDRTARMPVKKVHGRWKGVR
ncbi:hypothetical protein AN218_19875 [Streptomyces nanshensis]|uniref:Uncharacterized protein n=1 Tax=Streptomyces nanshensis TaxID=518642 RepID=A0A1E7L175_9ACTN|nr:hypothetical protein AN218_19875 [Streptomyces nanshensis]